MLHLNISNRKKNVTKENYFSMTIKRAYPQVIFIILRGDSETDYNVFIYNLILCFLHLKALHQISTNKYVCYVYINLEVEMYIHFPNLLT